MALWVVHHIRAACPWNHQDDLEQAAAVFATKREAIRYMEFNKGQENPIVGSYEEAVELWSDDVHPMYLQRIADENRFDCYTTR